ncbi:hypothetical protein EI77_01826 [Prosthecobacter fusiformis]|uniref:Uncharacterized protein n=1 Tax=Prosthecobacter fusiformis TaxID=48464 RepID=A0A4R7S6N0_9BACT|nr:hypothetical protein [Prosthecobacter fusiformis]TDU73356.1 hypothetical protein EI77_01826 [Prosthecobacter fusiformis]
MTPFYRDDAIRQRLIEFLGGETLDQVTAAYVTHSDGCLFHRSQLRPPQELDWFLERDLDIARSLGDTHSLLFHLDIEYVNFDSPAEAHLDPVRAFEIQEPVVKVIECLLLHWGIRPLHILTGQGHHFVWRIGRDSDVARRLELLDPAPEFRSQCVEQVPPEFAQQIDAKAQSAFGAQSLLLEYMAQRIKADAASLMDIPVEITAVHVGPGRTGRREIVSVDISEYGDPLYSRMIRQPFTYYLKPWMQGLGDDVRDQIPLVRVVPLHEMDVKLALQVRQVEAEVRELAKRACVRIPDETHGTGKLLDEYLGSPLKRFHEYFYSDHHDPEERWPETYHQTPGYLLPPCMRSLVEDPNDRLLKPAGMQLITRSLLAKGWHPRHIAGYIRSKFENSGYGWGMNWGDYSAAIRADFYTRVFAGLRATGLDELVDFNCVSTREKGFCLSPCDAGSCLAPLRQTLLTHPML